MLVPFARVGNEGDEDSAYAAGGWRAQDVEEARRVAHKRANEEIERRCAEDELVEVEESLAAVLRELGLDVPGLSEALAMLNEKIEALRQT